MRRTSTPPSATGLSFVHVIEEALAGRSDRIKAYSIATSVFGRDERFDPQLDSIVRIEAGRLRRSLDRYYLTDGRDSRVRIDIPVGATLRYSARRLRSALMCFHVRRNLRPSEIIELRKDVANRVARAQPYGAVQSDHARDSDGAAPETLGSYAAVLLFFAYWRRFDRAMIEAVRVGLERAIATEPEYAEAHACAFRFRHPIDAPEPDPLERAVALAIRSVELAPNTSWARYALGLARWYSGTPQAALDAVEIGRALNPNDTTILADLGQRYAMLARWDKALPLLDESYATNPAQPGSYRIGLFLYHFAHRRFADALAEARRVNAPQVLYGHVAVAAAAELGRDDEAADAALAIRGLDPDYGGHVIADLESRHVAPELVPLIVAGSRRLAWRSPGRTRSRRRGQECAHPVS